MPTIPCGLDPRRVTALLTGLTLLAAGRVDAQRRHNTASNAPDRQPRTSCVVKSVADGDTFTCANGTKVRLLLIDTPERDQKPFGAAARRYLAGLLATHTVVQLERDVRAYDRYGRLLAYVYLANGRMVNEEMARAGYAVPLSYPPNVRHLERIRTAVGKARSAKRGLWSTSAFDCEPRDHRRRIC